MYDDKHGDMDIEDEDLFEEDPGFTFDFGVGDADDAVEEGGKAVDESFEGFSELGTEMDDAMIESDELEYDEDEY